MYKVYIKLDDNKCIVGVESTAFYTEEELIKKGYIYLDEGENGEVYGHAQPNYLLKKYGKTTYDEKGNTTFKYLNNEVIELTEQEKNKLFNKQIEVATEQEKINAQLMREIALLKVGEKNGL